MKSNYELANELGLLAIETIKDAKLQNKILTNLKMLFDNKDYRSLPNPYKMDLDQMAMLQKWHYEAGEIINENIRIAIHNAQENGMTNKDISKKLDISTAKIKSLINSRKDA